MPFETVEVPKRQPSTDPFSGTNSPGPVSAKMNFSPSRWE
jgi:hypothetical protein